MWKNMGLQQRIFSAFIFIGTIVLIVALIGWLATARLSSHINTLSNNTLPRIDNLWKVNEAQSRVHASEKVLLANVLNEEQRKKELDRIQSAFKDITEGLSQYEKTPRDAEEDKIYKKISPEVDKWKAASQEYLQIHDKFLRLGINNSIKVDVELLKQGKSNPTESTSATVAVDVIKEMNDYLLAKLDPAFQTATNGFLELLTYNKNLAETVTKSAEQDVASSTFWIIVALLIGPLTAVIFGRYFSNTIAKPLGAKIAGVVGVAEKISHGDLTTLVPESENQDEIGKLQNSFRTMSKNLNSLITQVQKSGIQITTSATQIAASGKQLEATVTEQVASTNEVAATAKEIAATSAQLVKTMDEVERKSQMTAQAAGDSQHELTEMEKTMRLLAEATSTIANKLGVINEKANNINSIVTTITKVADQTNLLSLNAAIEAEKAGEYGTGFAVVAREIRRLADQTAVATLDIENMVKEMQGAVATGVMEVDSFTKEVERGVEDVRNIGVKLESIIEQVQTLTPRFQQVSNSVENQSQGAVQISEAMEQLSEASSQTAASLREINGAIGQLNDAAAGLRQEISNFRVA
ncbi:MAG: methyl-accepting chemotaxis protein [Nostocaceae cyanobacterium]|nr:methyl-accepting chemotaxis protein [Nostocaceae cyanobacterium]